jgi:hypothetical protein
MVGNLLEGKKDCIELTIVYCASVRKKKMTDRICIRKNGWQDATCQPEIAYTCEPVKLSPNKNPRR